MPDPRPVTVDHDGLRIAVLDWGGDGVPLLLLHPNGFCAGFFDPIARRLAASGSYRPVGVDLRGHGSSDAPPPPGHYRYELMAADVAAVLDHLDLDGVVAVGGSLGGGVAIHLDHLQPGRLRRLMLCEPIAWPDPAGSGPANPLVAVALRRRAVWPSREVMTRSYGSRPPLDALDPEALRAYVEWGVVQREDGAVELACPPEVEAAIFGSTPILEGIATAWEYLGGLSAPAVILAGTRSDVPRSMFEDQAERTGTRLVLVEGGHFFLHEDTARGVALVAEHCDTSTGG